MEWYLAWEKMNRFLIDPCICVSEVPLILCLLLMDFDNSTPFNVLRGVCI